MNGYAKYYIPVSPHVKKFLTTIYGEEYQISKVDFLGLLLIPFFTKEVQLFTGRSKITDSVKTDVFPILISFDFFQRQGYFISHDQLKLIGRTLDKYFREMMYNHVNVFSAAYGVAKKQCIVDFCELYGITEEDFSSESLYRDYQRKQERFSQIEA